MNTRPESLSALDLAEANPVRDLALVRDVDIASVQLLVEQVWEQWCTAWGCSSWSCATWAVSEASQSPQATGLAWLPLHDERRLPASAWEWRPDNLRERLACALIGRTVKATLPDSDWSHLAADAAWADLRDRIRRSLHAGIKTTPYDDFAFDAMPVERASNAVWADQFKTLSGALLIHEQRTGVQWLFSRSAYADCKAALPAGARQSQSGVHVDGVLNGVSNGHVSFELGLGELEIAVDDLLGLQIGDVVRFPVKLSDQLVLLGGDAASQPALHCQLGQQDGRLAVQIAGTLAASL